MTTPTPLLQLTNVAAVYDRASLALHDISLTVHAGGIVALLGANGAGKTTTLRAISNTVEREGEVRFAGSALRGVDVPGYASLMAAVLCMGGIQLVCLGIMGEYIGRIYREAKQRPLFVVEETSAG